jgi:hypothetical protein
VSPSRYCQDRKATNSCGIRAVPAYRLTSPNLHPMVKRAVRFGQVFGASHRCIGGNAMCLKYVPFSNAHPRWMCDAGGGHRAAAEGSKGVSVCSYLQANTRPGRLKPRSFRNCHTGHRRAKIGHAKTGHAKTGDRSESEFECVAGLQVVPLLIWRCGAWLMRRLAVAASYVLRFARNE